MYQPWLMYNGNVCMAMAIIIICICMATCMYVLSMYVCMYVMYVCMYNMYVCMYVSTCMYGMAYTPWHSTRNS
jgi:hypothetical protein